MWNSIWQLFSGEPQVERSGSMGNSSKKLAKKCSSLSREEQSHLAVTFGNAARNTDQLKDHDVIKFWSPLIDPRLSQFLTNFLFGFGPKKRAHCEFNRFAELYVCNVRGSIDEKTQAFFECLGKEYHADVEISYQLLREYCESIVSTFMRMVKCADTAKEWMSKGFKSKPGYIQALGEAIAATVAPDPDNPHTECDEASVSRWLQSNRLLSSMCSMVFETLYGIRDRHSFTDEASPGHKPTLLPRAEGIGALPDYPAFVDLSHMVWLNSHLPYERQHKWRFLFSSHIHGESYSTMAGRIQNLGPTVIIIEDPHGHIFGGFATHDWRFGPDWYGSDQSFLFTLAPKMRMYPASGFNNHYQYMNNQTKTLPNGLLMGGQFNFGAIWVDADHFGTGSCAESCTTYRGYKRLSREKSFHIASIEVWGVGDLPVIEKEEDERDTSILDKNPEAKAILDMAGRTRHSEGIREPPPS